MRSGFKLVRAASEGGRLDVASRAPLDPRHAALFPSDGHIDRFVRELAQHRAVPVKELVESLEFFARVRAHVRASSVADLCCGHGLTGVLFALFERRVERVVLIDRSLPPSARRVLDAAIAVGPWVRDKVELRQGKLRKVAGDLEPGTSVVAVHACGLRTDQCLDVALGTGGALAVMPCCYPAKRSSAPATLVQHLGESLAFDVDRTYRLEAAGYRVRWDAIPEEVTPMNRILVGVRRAEPGA